jgi:hypothetical protein
MSLKVPDYRLKPLNKFQRPYFSPKRNSYEIDYVTQTDPDRPQDFVFYLFCINLNTRYLTVRGLDYKTFPTNENTVLAFEEIYNHILTNFRDNEIKHLRGDADKAFGTLILKNLERKKQEKLGEFRYVKNVFTTYLANLGIDLYLNSSKYTNKNRIIDRAIGIIRYKVGSPSLMMNENIVRQVVDIYNRTPHSAFNHEFTPLDVQSNPETENYYIRENYYKLQEIKQLQRDEGLFKYQPGNILLVHLDEEKTKMKFYKRRRNFDHLAMFVRYEFGNVVCRLLVIVNEGKRGIGIMDKSITIPIYYTKFISTDMASIPLAYKKALST